MPAVTFKKSEGKETEDKLELEDSEAIEKFKEELKKMRRNWDMAIEDPEKWLALEIAEDYFNLFQEETRYISDTENIEEVKNQKIA
ncbi:hypothetical protein O181_043696 [Austropuccinia psidii MF-1]|uniref:Uncharacterized protein n=1 Tax=Austropuccinia psidii MF-1 TaxID=1389203 RepID=A0A9Q3HG81_9BASI|nr:hypothetical protein [Austropuccinia psidii MF-1]